MTSYLINDYIAGAFGGASGLVVGHPLDTLKVLFQTRQLAPAIAGKKVRQWDTIRAVWHQHGLIKGFYRGLGFPLYSCAIVNSVYFGVYGHSLQLLNSWTRDKSSPINSLQTSNSSYTTLFLAGCCGGFVQCFVLCPTDLVKVLLQSQITDSTAPTGARALAQYFKGPMEATLWLYRRQGIVAGFYRGLPALLMRDVPLYGVHMVVYECLHKIFTNSRFADRHDIGTSMLAGGLTGVITWAMGLPFDTVKSLMQADATVHRYKSILDCCRHVYISRGIPGFFAGLVVVSIRAFPVNAMTFLIYTKTLAALERRHRHGVISATCTSNSTNTNSAAGSTDIHGKVSTSGAQDEHEVCVAVSEHHNAYKNAVLAVAHTGQDHTVAPNGHHSASSHDVMVNHGTHRGVHHVDSSSEQVLVGTVHSSEKVLVGTVQTSVVRILYDNSS